MGHQALSRVLKSDRTGLTVALRYRFTGPVRPVTGGNRLNSNSNSKTPMQLVPTGLPAGLIGLPAGLTGLKFKGSRATGLPAGLIGLPAGLTGLIGGSSWAGPFFFFFFFDLTLNPRKL